MKLYEFFEVHDWCQCAAAQDKFGINCSVFGENAEKFCLLGGVNRLVLKDFMCNNPALYVEVNAKINNMKLAVKRKGSVGIATFNDTPGRTKEEIIALLKEADI